MTFNELLRGNAAEVAAHISATPYEWIDKPELVAALINALNRIDRLEKAINQVKNNQPTRYNREFSV